MAIMNAEDIVTKLRELRPIITVRFKTREVGLFGSFVRGEQSANSDIDVLAEFEDGADLFDLIGLTLYLEEVFQRKVDVVPKRALRSELQESVLREVVAV
jgi:predicted nucleotidyltransferase